MRGRLHCKINSSFVSVFINTQQLVDVTPELCDLVSNRSPTFNLRIPVLGADLDVSHSVASFHDDLATIFSLEYIL